MKGVEKCKCFRAMTQQLILYLVVNWVVFTKNDYIFCFIEICPELLEPQEVEDCPSASVWLMAYTTAWEYSLNRDDRPVALIDAIASYCAENLQAYF